MLESNHWCDCDCKCCIKAREKCLGKISKVQEDKVQYESFDYKYDETGELTLQVNKRKV